MSLVPTIYLQSPISSELVNNRFKRIIPAGPKEGFHLSQKAPGSWIYEVKNTRDSLLGNSMVTRDGVVLHETSNVVGELTVAAGATYAFTVEFDHASGDLVGTLNAFDITARAIRDTETIFGAANVPALATEALESYLLNIGNKEEMLEESIGGIMSVQTRNFDPAQISGPRGVERSVPIPFVSPKLLPAGVDTTVDVTSMLGNDFSSEIWQRRADSLYLKLWLGMDSTSVGSDIVINTSVLRLIDGTTLAPLALQTVATLSNLTAGDGNIVEVDIGSAAMADGLEYVPGDHFFLNITRDGTNVNDDCTSDLYLMALAMFYPASRIGTIYPIL